MDEIDWIKNTKKALLTFTILFVGFAIFLSFLFILGSIIRNDWEGIGTTLSVMLLIGIAPPLFLGLCYIIILFIEKIMNSGRKVMNFDNGYIRDLPRHCSPAICSLIYDLKIDVYKDYTATILYLCTKKYIELVKYGNTYKFKLGKQKDFSGLNICERYVLDIVINKNKFDEFKFQQLIFKEAQERKLIVEKRCIEKIKKILFVVIAIILLVITARTNIILAAVCSGILFSVIVSMLYKYTYRLSEGYSKEKEYKRTEDGKKLAILFKRLKKYIKEYTLIKDKEIDHVQVLESYIPYALALGEADAIEEFIKHNEQYRNLIYNRKSIQ